MKSNYGATISSMHKSLQVNEANYGRNKQELEKQKLKANVTNLPGFTELKIDEDLSK